MKLKFNLSALFKVKSRKLNLIKGLLLLSFMLFSETILYAQNATVTLSVKNAHIKQLFESIEKQTDYKFSYRDVDLDNKEKVTVNVTNEPIETLLKNVLTPRKLQFELHGSKVLITRMPLESASNSKKKIRVTGTITGSNNEPLIGASVAVSGNNTLGTMTDLDGQFSLDNVPANALIKASYIGYLSQELQVKPIVNIILKEDTKLLDEVVVVGYTVQKKVNLSGAVDVVSSKSIENRPLVNVAQGLQGVIPNLNVSIGDGNANSSPKFNIRGTASINGGEPLILVDNIPVTSGELSRLNTSDIENITVLKDASSAAIYGARAAFGVILVTTKSAKTEKIKVDVNAYYSTRKITKLPEYITDPYTVMDIKNQAAYPLYNLYNKEQMDIAKDISANPTKDRVIINPANKDLWMYLGSTNWLDEVYTDMAPSYTVNANVSRRSDKGGYYLSSEYFRQDGMFRVGNDIYERYNMRGKMDFQIASWLNVNNNTTFTYREYDKPYVGLGSFFHTINRLNSLAVPYNPDGSYTQEGADSFGTLENGGRTISSTQEFMTSFGFTVDLLKNVWQIKADMTFRRDNENVSDYLFPVYYKMGPERPLEARNTTSSALAKAAFTQYNVYNIFTNFNKTFKEKHFVQAMVGFNQENRRANNFWLSRNQLISLDYPTPTLATGTIKGEESISEWSVRGLFYRLNYVFDNKYIIEFNGRYDGTSRFPKKDRFGFFPSGSAAWNIAEESFMNNLKESLSLSQLKIRGSYGSLGNQNMDDTYAYLPSMAASESGWILDGSRPVGIGAPGLVSSTLTWEKISTMNGGVDLAFLNNRFTATLDVFQRKTTDMLTKGATLPNVLGTKEPQENAADLKTSGWELSLGWKDQFALGGSPFIYSARFVLSDSRSKITKFANENRKLDNYYVGQELGEIWGLTTEGFFQSQEELDAHANQSAVGEDDQSYRFYVGDLKFKDLNGDNKINRGNWTVDDPGDFKKIGNTSTRFPYSVDLSGEWKGFDLRVFIQGVGKKDWYPGGGNHYFWGIYAQPWTNVQVQNMDHWTPETPNAYFPRMKAYIAESSGSELACAQTKYLQDASYTRMKNLTFGYTLPGVLTKKCGIQRLRLYFSAENLFEITHLTANKNIDPEALEGAVYPLQRSYSFGLNLNF